MESGRVVGPPWGLEQLWTGCSVLCLVMSQIIVANLQMHQDMHRRVQDRMTSNAATYACTVPATSTHQVL